MNFAGNLKTARIDRGYTQVYMAERLGIDKSTYNGYESGKRQPDVKRLKEIANILGVSVDSLIETNFSFINNNAPVLSDTAISIAKQYEAASPVIQASVRAVLSVQQEASGEVEHNNT